MGTDFFTTLALWQKMTLVLACAIVMTIGLGYGKLLYNRHRLRKYEILAHENPSYAEKATVVPLTDDIESNAGSPVPFGIRAIQSGIEIDGVWISPCSTPTRNLSKDSLISPSVRPQIQSPVSEPALLHPGSPSTSLRSNTMTSTASRSASSDRSDSTRRPRGSPAFSFYSTIPNQHYRRLATERDRLQTPLEQESLAHKIRPHRATHERKTPNHKHSQVTDPESVVLDDTMSDGDDYWKDSTHGFRVSKLPSAQVFTIGQHSRRGSSITAHEDGDMGMLDRHRLSHVASTGQLGRRVSPHAKESQRTGSDSSLAIEENYQSCSLGPTTTATPSEALLSEDVKADEDVKEFSRRCKVSPKIGDEITNAELLLSKTPETPKRLNTFRTVNSGFEVSRQGSLNDTRSKELESRDEGDEVSVKSSFSFKVLPRILQRQRYDSLKGPTGSLTKNG